MFIKYNPYTGTFQRILDTNPPPTSGYLYKPHFMTYTLNRNMRRLGGEFKDDPYNKTLIPAYGLVEYSPSESFIDKALVDLAYPPNYIIERVSTTKVWDKSMEAVVLTATVDDKENKDVKYEVSVNDKLIYDSGKHLHPPLPIAIYIGKQLLVKKINEVKLVATNSDGLQSIGFLEIFVEDREMFTYERVFDVPENYLSNTGITTIRGEGLVLLSPGRKQFSMDLPTLGKSRIEKITAYHPYKGEIVYNEKPNSPQMVSGNYRVLFSLDNRIFKTYRGGKWETVAKSSIYTRGIPVEELPTMSEEVWSELIPDRIYKEKLTMVVGVEQDIILPELYKFKIDYCPNQPPVILDSAIEPDVIHDEYTKITVKAEDMEGDSIRHRTSIKRAETEEFKIISPRYSAWNTTDSHKFTVEQAFNYSSFNTGENEIMVEISDTRGAITSWSGVVMLSNINPDIKIVRDDYGFQAVIGDQDGDKVSYSVYLNGIKVIPESDYVDTPVSFKLLYPREYVKLGANANKAQIVVKDTFGGERVETFMFTGYEKGIIFYTESGTQLNNEQGIYLADVTPFDGVMIGGQTSPIVELTFVNKHEFPIQNAELYVREYSDKGMKINLSKDRTPFTGEGSLLYKRVIGPGESRTFYMNISTTSDVDVGGHFYLDIKADPVYDTEEKGGGN